MTLPTISPYDWPELRSVETQPPQRICNVCNAPMVHLADLSAAGTFPAKRIFRCRICDNVVAESR
jgi:hypothetical protein